MQKYHKSLLTEHEVLTVVEEIAKNQHPIGIGDVNW